ncbi:hypothetical protein B1813_07325 [Saccharomonospora piscinae]|uniref:Uncharacterized protein n=1 Tax=Saccharomonospora piscinae TaxID=687388 RepID=A0A1V9A4K3_SACPI|nr:hypothetical protein [Saccharomonospora piscinae]OQO92072.1 hypothetical protein B1813_07325 [Saccharomonospora piscinae]
MLYIVLLLVLTALGLVAAALVTASSLWAWVSIGVSGLAGALLVVDRVRRDRPAGRVQARPQPAATGTGSTEIAETADGAGAAEAGDATEPEPSRAQEPVAAVEPADAEPEPEPFRPTLVAAGGVAEREPRAREGVDSLTDTAPRTALLASSGELAGADADPPEEDTRADDALLVATLDAEVLVVDEYPRYHLADCGWLGPRATIPLSVKEARDLGFSPCGLCGPDAALTAAHRRRLRRRSTA